MNYISESIIRGVFPKVVRSVVNVDASVILSFCFAHRKGFCGFSVLSHDLKHFTFFVFSLWGVPKKKVNENLVAFRFYGGFCFTQFPMSLTVYFISCFETSDSKTLPVKCISQSDFDLLDFDID